jgi:4-diphosphocytidyl-2-C-methyl-D-erythritol kinase
MSGPERGLRRARVRALAKINLDLRVLGKRPDGFHELRTVFQTISMADIVDIAFAPGRRADVSLYDDAGIPDNLMARAARLAMDAMRITGQVEMRLRKSIPMGAGLGGGSSDAAAVLLALPALAGGCLSIEELTSLAAQLGSDVPFFLLGGTAVGIGRGTELFPLPDAPARPAVLVAPGAHVDTPGAYAALSPRLTTESQQNKIVSFQAHVWDLSSGKLAGNDFETVVFERHGRLPVLKQALIRAGASVAMMTGSGSAVFGLFPTREGASRAWRRLAGGSGLRAEEKAYRVSLVGRARYRTLWRRALAEHIIPGIWPPRSRYMR